MLIKVIALIVPSACLRLQVACDLSRYMAASVQSVNLQVNNQNHFQKLLDNKMTSFMSEGTLKD